jgi:hypothetical protein
MIPVHSDDPVIEPGTIVAVAWMIILAVVAVTGVVIAIFVA